MRALLVLFFSLLSFELCATKPLPPMQIEQLEPELFLHKSYNHIQGYGLVSSNGLVLLDKQDAWIVDTPWNERDIKKLMDWIKQNQWQLKGAIATHFHSDRAGGIGFLNNRGITTYATAQTNALLKFNHKPLAKLELNENEEPFPASLAQVFYPGPGHSEDNIVVWMTKSKTLYGGCLVRSLAAKGLGNTDDANLTQWPVSVKHLLGQYKNVKQVIPGHGARGDVSLLKHTHVLTQIGETIKSH